MKIDNGIRELYNSDTAKLRQELYRGATRKIKQAIENQYYIEAISLCESILADRLEARISHLNDHIQTARRHSTLGVLVKRLKATEKIKGNVKIHEIYNDIKLWSLARNKAIHNTVKLTEGEIFTSWEFRYNELKLVALQGTKLFNSLKSEYEKMKRRDKKAPPIAG